MKRERYGNRSTHEIEPRRLLRAHIYRFPDAPRLMTSHSCFHRVSLIKSATEFTDFGLLNLTVVSK